jgi:hypothetical protein
MAATNVQAFPGDVTIPGDVTVTGETILGTATYRKRRDWNRTEKAYVYLGNVRTSTTTGIRLDVSLNNSNSGYVMNSFQITVAGADGDHSGGQLVYSAVGLHNASTLSSIDIGYVYVEDSTGLYTYQLWLKDPVVAPGGNPDLTGTMDAYLNCQGYYIFDTGVSDVAHGGSAPTNFNVGVPGVVCDTSGNVGIGTNAPIGKLQVDITNASAEASAWDATKVLFGDIANGNSQGLGFGVYTNSHASIISLAPNTAWRGLEYWSAHHKWHVGGATAPAMTLDSSGNVGIGTATPRAGLDVRSGDGSESDTHAIFGKAVAASAGWSGIRLGTPYTAAHDAYCSVIESYNDHNANHQSILRFKTSSGDNAVATEHMRIDSAGSVGIGTNSVGAKLDIIGASTDPGGYPTLHVGDGTADYGDYGMVNLTRHATTGGSKAHLAFIRSGNTLAAMGFYNNDTNTFGIWASFGAVTETPSISINSSKRVGIGTSNAIMHTDINYAGGVAINYGLKLHNTTASGGSNRMNTILFTDNNSTQGAIGGYRQSFDSNYTGGLVFYIGSQPTGYTQGAPNSTAQATGSLTEAMRIKYNGYVGIGTSDPVNTMHIYRDANEQTTGLLIEKENAGTGAAGIFFAVSSTAASETANLAKGAILFQRESTNGRGSLKLCVDTVNDSNWVTSSDAKLTIGYDGTTTVAGNLVASNFYGTGVYIGSRSRILEHVVYANSAVNGTLYFEFGALRWHDDSEVFAIASVKGNPQVNGQNAGFMFSLHKSYGTGITGSIVVHRTFSRSGSWSIGVSASPSAGSGTYIYANGMAASKGYYARALVFNCGA